MAQNDAENEGGVQLKIQLAGLVTAVLLTITPAHAQECLFLAGSTTGSPDAFEDNDSPSTSGVIQVFAIPEQAQAHTFHVAGDSDWYTFAAEAGTPHDITLDQLGPAIGDLNTAAGAGGTIAVHDNLGAEVASVDDIAASGLTCFGDDLRLPPFQTDTSGVYFIEVRPLRNDVFGDDASYRMRLLVNTGPDVGILRLTVQSATNMSPIPLALVQTSSNRFTLSDTQGFSALADNPGMYSASVQATGFEAGSFDFSLAESQFTDITVQLTREGEIFADGFE